MVVSAPAGRSAQTKPAMRRPMFLIGIAMSLVAFLLVVVLGSSLANRATAGTAQISVVVAAHDIAQRHVIGAGDLAITRLPATAVPPGALLSASEATGQVAQINVLTGQPVTGNLIAKPGTAAPRFLPIP